jgi:transposase
VRVTTLFNRILGLSGVSVATLSFTDVGLVLGLRRSRRRRLQCPCGVKTWARYDSSRRRWRHLDFGTCHVWLEADVHRIDCAGCGKVRTEQVPWARPGARHTRDFEDVLVWLAQRMDKSGVARLLRCSWEAVDRIVKRVVVEHVDDARLDGLYRIGVDEISYKRGHKYLTVVADHDTGRVVWVGQQRSREAFEEFFEILGDRRAGQLQAVTMDASKAYVNATRERAPQAAICLDPFHVIKWCNEALYAVFRANTPDLPPETGYKPSRRHWRRARYAVMVGAEKLDTQQRDFINQLRRHRYRLFRAWQLKEQLRDLYRLNKPKAAAAYLKRWTTSALRSRIPAFINLARRLRSHFDLIVAAVHLGLSNSRLEGINTKIRVIQRRGYGFRNLDSLTAMIYLCIGGITIDLPTQR